MENKRRCPICDGEEHSEYLWDSRENLKIPILKCKNCGHIYQNITEFKDIYSDSLFSIIARGDTLTPNKEKIKQLDEKAFERYEYYKYLFENAESALEIGSSIGSFVHLLKLQGKDAYGIEPDKSYASFSEKQYFFSQEAVLLENFNSEKKFDLITSFHVIEHLNDPGYFAKKCFDLLNDEGRIIVECPSWEIRSYGSRKETIWEPHIHYFSLLTMYKLLGKYFAIDAYSFIGSAMFMSGKKLKTSKSVMSIPLKIRLLSFYGNLLRILFPAVFNGIKIFNFLRKLLVHILLSRKKFSASRKKLWKYFKYKIKENLYLKKESGKGKTSVTHITSYKGWGNNSGDVVLSKCVRDSMNLTEKRKYKMVALNHKIDKSLINQINSSDFLMIGGGGLFLPDTNKNTISGWQWAVSKEQLKSINVPIVLFAIGYNYFRGQEPNELFIENLDLMLAKANFIGIRNNGSIKKINELTDDKFKDKIRFQPCPTTIISKLYPSLRNNGIEKKKVAVNIAFDRYETRFGKKIYTILDQIALALKNIENQGYSIINVSHISADEKFRIVLDKHFVNYKEVKLQYMFPNEVYRFYSEVDLVIGMRGHAQMIPFGLQTPIMSLGTHDKMRWFLEDIDALDWYIDLNTENNISAMILERFDLIKATKENLISRIQEKQNLFYSITKENLDYIKDVI